jgi:hypothetical protein
VTPNSLRCVFSWIIAAVLLFRAGTAIYESFEARNWPDVDAIVVESDARWVENRQAVRRSMWSYQLHLRYAYTIEGRSYVGTRAGFSAWGAAENFNPFNSSIARKFPAGVRVQAHYDPLNPSRSVLETAPRMSGWIALVLGLLLAKVGITYARRVEEEKKQLAEK